MINNIIRTSVYFIVFILLQVFVLNNIHYLHLATPFLYLYCLLKVPVGISRSKMITISFVLGLVIDMFSNTPGIHSAACTLVGLLREPLIRFLQGEDLPDGVYPSFHTFGYKGFIYYALLLIVVHHITLFLIESLSFFETLFLFMRIVASVMTTALLIFIVELFNFEAKKVGE